MVRFIWYRLWLVCRPMLTLPSFVDYRTSDPMPKPWLAGSVGPIDRYPGILL